MLPPSTKSTPPTWPKSGVRTPPVRADPAAAPEPAEGEIGGLLEDVAAVHEEQAADLAEERRAQLRVEDDLGAAALRNAVGGNRLGGAQRRRQALEGLRQPEPRPAGEDQVRLAEVLEDEPLEERLREADLGAD